jgi:hypothetical protein
MLLEVTLELEIKENKLNIKGLIKTVCMHQNEFGIGNVYE